MCLLIRHRSGDTRETDDIKLLRNLLYNWGDKSNIFLKAMLVSFKWFNQVPNTLICIINAVGVQRSKKSLGIEFLGKAS